jgi:energy-converting hydrogenase Eha subunit A
MRTFNVSLYFTITIIVFASTGVWLPYLFEILRKVGHSTVDLNQNIVTYYVAIYMSAILDYILKLLDSSRPNRKPAVLSLVLFTLIVLGTTAWVLYDNTKDHVTNVSILAILGIIVSYIAWWFTNFNNASFDLTSPLGGDPNNPLKNA